MSITFAEAMPESDIYLRMWDAEQNSRDVIIKNVIEVLGEEKAPLPFEVEGTEELIIAKTVSVPEWIKNSAGWWSDGLISDNDFVQGIQYLIQQSIIIVPETAQSQDQSSQIPNWIKNNAGWWAEGLIDEDDFINGIQWLISNGIMRI